MTKRSTTKPKNPTKSHKLRHPSNFPKSAQWKLEGDAELLKSLSAEDAEWMKAFLEGEFGSNPQVLTADVNDRRAAWTRSNANARDVSTILRPRDRVDHEIAESGVLPKRTDTEIPTVIQMREKASIDAVQRDTATNHVEDAMIELLDNADAEVPRPRKVHRLKHHAESAVPKVATPVSKKRRIKPAA